MIFYILFKLGLNNASQVTEKGTKIVLLKNIFMNCSFIGLKCHYLEDFFFFQKLSSSMISFIILNSYY